MDGNVGSFSNVGRYNADRVRTFPLLIFSPDINPGALDAIG